MPVLKIVTLGCKVNQYESEYAREGLRRLGYIELTETKEVFANENDELADGVWRASAKESPDLILVNTCTVTAGSEAKCRKLIRRLAKEHPQAEIVVMGCYAARAAEEVRGLPNVGEVIADKRELPDFLSRRGLHEVPDGISAFAGRHRAWIKVQDGCGQRCSYCIVPLVRPHLSSRPIHEVLAEIRRITAAGFAEIVLTGIHLGHYGLEQNDSNVNLVRLMRSVLEIDGSFRIRLSSIEAPEVTKELLDLTAERPDRICPHFHVPMQSGSDRILRLMRRRQSSSQFVERCLAIRERLDLPALTTDAIVGFPGETEADFAETCATAEKAGFSKIHVFRFSPRQGTPAAEMPNRVPQRIYQDWATNLGRLGERLQSDYFRQLEGKTLQTLVEDVRTCAASNEVRGSADRFMTVAFSGGAELEGKLIGVKIVAAEGNLLRGTA